MLAERSPSPSWRAAGRPQVEAPVLSPHSYWATLTLSTPTARNPLLTCRPVASGLRGAAAVLALTALVSGCGTAAGTTRSDQQVVGPVLAPPQEAGVPTVVPTAAPADRAAGAMPPSAVAVPGAVVLNDLGLFLKETYSSQPWLADISTLSPFRRGVNVETRLAVEADGQPSAGGICVAVTAYLLSSRYTPAVPAWPGLIVSAADGQLLAVRTRADDDCAVSAEEATSYGPEDTPLAAQTPAPLPVPPSTSPPEPVAPSTSVRR